MNVAPAPSEMLNRLSLTDLSIGRTFSRSLALFLFFTVFAHSFHPNTPCQVYASILLFEPCLTVSP